MEHNKLMYVCALKVSAESISVQGKYTLSTVQHRFWILCQQEPTLLKCPSARTLQLCCSAALHSNLPQQEEKMTGTTRGDFLRGIDEPDRDFSWRHQLLLMLASKTLNTLLCLERQVLTKLHFLFLFLCFFSISLEQFPERNHNGFRDEAWTQK